MIRRAGWPPVSRFSTTNCPNHVESAYCKCVPNFSFSPWVEVIFSMFSIVFSRCFIVFDGFFHCFFKVFDWFFKVFDWFFKVFDWFFKVSHWFFKVFHLFFKVVHWFSKVFHWLSSFFIDLSTVLVDFSMVLIHFSTTLIVFLHLFNFFLEFGNQFSVSRILTPLVSRLVVWHQSFFFWLITKLVVHLLSIWEGAKSAYWTSETIIHAVFLQGLYPKDCWPPTSKHVKEKKKLKACWSFRATIMVHMQHVLPFPAARWTFPF